MADKQVNLGIKISTTDNGGRATVGALRAEISQLTGAVNQNTAALSQYARQSAEAATSSRNL